MKKPPTNLYLAKVYYLQQHGFEGHIKRVEYWYRRMFNSRRGKSASQLAKEINFQEYYSKLK